MQRIYRKSQKGYSFMIIFPFFEEEKFTIKYSKNKTKKIKEKVYFKN